ncbi:MAG: hypothetical protein FD155_94 [Bacteroidetes bacterium]|nr:MAG: hypothetical protein FD155_94 [Bacteroidota bacterium]
MLIFRCAAPLVSILFHYPTNIIATLWLNFQVQRTVIFVEFCPVVFLKVLRTEIFDAKFFNQYLPNPCARNKALLN